MHNQGFYKLSFILAFFISGCDNSVNSIKNTPQEQKELKNYLNRVKADIVYVKGGTFLMGDFCKKMRDGGAYCSPEKDTKPLHEVELTSFSISKFKVAHEDYSFYLKMTGQPEQHFEKKWRNEMLAEMNYFKDSPAIISWREAENYCTWLKKETGLPFSLPTEAQWEYAARSRGQYILVATDDGKLREDEKTGQGENYATDEDRRLVEKTSGIDSTSITFPIDKYPPTKFGLYGMADNGYEWVEDWYDPEYYNKSPRTDPRGPENPIIKDNDTRQYLKVRRGGYHPDPTGDVGLTFFRGYNITDSNFPDGTTVRCVVNSPEPIK